MSEEPKLKIRFITFRTQQSVFVTDLVVVQAPIPINIGKVFLPYSHYIVGRRVRKYRTGTVQSVTSSPMQSSRKNRNYISNGYVASSPSISSQLLRGFRKHSNKYTFCCIYILSHVFLLHKLR